MSYLYIYIFQHGEDCLVVYLYIQFMYIICPLEYKTYQETYLNKCQNRHTIDLSIMISATIILGKSSYKQQSPPPGIYSYWQENCFMHELFRRKSLYQYIERYDCAFKWNIRCSCLHLIYTKYTCIVFSRNTIILRIWTVLRF